MILSFHIACWSELTASVTYNGKACRDVDGPSELGRWHQTGRRRAFVAIAALLRSPKTAGYRPPRKLLRKTNEPVSRPAPSVKTAADAPDSCQTGRNNASVDVFNTADSTLVAQVRGTGASAFTGLTVVNGAIDNSVSGPDGINVVGNMIYVGDVNSVKVIDPSIN